jgi:hypothetical protein
MLALAGLHWWNDDINAKTSTNTGITIGSADTCDFVLPVSLGVPPVLGTHIQSKHKLWD